MIRQNAYRFALTVLLIAFAGVVWWKSGDVPEWLIGLIGFGTGNVFRMQGPAPK